MIIRDPVRGLSFGSRKRAGDRAKVSGKAGEGILMILACGWPRRDSPLGLFFTAQITALGVPKAHLITIDACKMFVCDRRN
ncbi:hypothetical protein [Microcoleus sp. B5-D4]|uniref:hypothetical protein n=1 Tax=Microcoleus sp. B5-D4 TaxID=2818681 RepID=UPI002FD4F695